MRSTFVVRSHIKETSKTKKKNIIIRVIMFECHVGLIYPNLICQLCFLASVARKMGDYPG